METLAQIQQKPAGAENLLDVISGTLALVLMFIMGIFILTSLLSFCPLYLPFGVSTTKKKSKEDTL